jgi:cytochrome c553
MGKLKWALSGIAALGTVVVFGGWFWAQSRVAAVFDQDWETHSADFPIPWPLTDAEVAALGEEANLDVIARERANDRGEHLVNAVFACSACHGGDFGGGTMIEEGAIGHVRAPNLTRSGAVQGFTPADWDRAVRHGVLQNGKTSLMPVGDYRELADRELSDIIVYIDGLPAKDGGATLIEWGPMGTLLIAFGALQVDVEKVADHFADHAKLPPEPGINAEFGQHMVSVCVGCHRDDLNGGPMPFGPPDWPLATNLTPHAEGLGGRDLDDFTKALRQGLKEDGTPLQVPMADVLPYTSQWTETELEAAWLYLQSIPALPTGE